MIVCLGWRCDGGFFAGQQQYYGKQDIINFEWPEASNDYMLHE